MISRGKRPVLLYVALLLAVIILLGIFFNYLVVFYVNTFSGYTIQYKKLQGSLLLESRIEGLKLSANKEGFTANAKMARINFLPTESLKKRELIFKTNFTDVTFLSDKTVKSQAAESAGVVLSMPFNSGWEYSKIAFLLNVGINSLKVSDFEAIAEQVRMKGLYASGPGKMTLDLELAFSPETTEEYLGEYKDFIFAPNEDGWYTARINVKGNPDSPQISIQSAMFQMNIHSE